jgi:FkbM family methyltransferase
MYHNNLKYYYRKLINKFSKYPIIYNHGFELNRILSFHKINLILDIGAYTGTYAQSLRRFGYTKEIISFEPIKESYNALVINSSKDKLWHIHERVALGNENKIIKINISKKKDSSSILKIKKNHLKLEPDSKIIEYEKVNMVKLDKIIKKYVKKKNSYLKIDTQGYEYPVLVGCGKLLKKIKLIQLELSLHKLYERQEGWEKILKYLEKFNFKIWNIIPGFKNKKNGQLMQFDVILYKDK